MKLLTAVGAGLVLGALVSIVQTEKKLLRQFRCWLCKRPTTYRDRGRMHHHDCDYCGISNKVPHGAAVGQLPDICVSIA